jgi:hypothetical protein
VGCQRAMTHLRDSERQRAPYALERHARSESYRPPSRHNGARRPDRGDGESPACPSHFADSRRGGRDPHGRGVSREAMLDRRLIQEWPLGCSGPVCQDAAGWTRLVDVEGRNADDAWAVADPRLVRFRGILANVVRGQVTLRRAARPVGRQAAADRHSSSETKRKLKWSRTARSRAS